jgi:hypothetical protein
MSNGGLDLQRIVLRADAVIGRRLETVLGTRGATDFLLRGFRLQGSAQRIAERPARAVLHALNMPTRGDVAQLRRQLACTHEELRELSRKLEETPLLTGEPGAPVGNER